MSRAAVYGLISADLDLQLLGLDPNATFSANATDSPTYRPFVIIRWEDHTATFADRGPQNLTIWVHDDGQDYARVNDMLQRIREVMADAVHVVGNDGDTLTESRWLGSSSDLYDDGYRTITRNATFRVVSRRS